MGGDMVSIGEIAHSTGVSRRMLRHWEQLGLIAPASIDASTGHRRYEPSQVGRVRTVAGLRALGFGLEAIRDLLDPALTEPRLVDGLLVRERQLVEEIDEASAQLAQVRARLASIEKGHHAMRSTLELTPLPALRLCAVRRTVRDETEIPHAAGELVALLREHLVDGAEGTQVVLTYDGTSHDAIVVTAGVEAGERAPDLAGVDVAALRDGVSVRFDDPPADVADAWIAVDAELAGRGLRTTGVYRQLIGPDGAVTLQAGVRAL